MWVLETTGLYQSHKLFSPEAWKIIQKNRVKNYRVARPLTPGNGSRLGSWSLYYIGPFSTKMEAKVYRCKERIKVLDREVFAGPNYIGEIKKHTRWLAVKYETYPELFI